MPLTFLYNFEYLVALLISMSRGDADFLGKVFVQYSVLLAPECFKQSITAVSLISFAIVGSTLALPACTLYTPPQNKQAEAFPQSAQCNAGIQSP